MIQKNCPRYKKCLKEWEKAKYRETLDFTCFGCPNYKTDMRGEKK